MSISKPLSGAALHSKAISAGDVTTAIGLSVLFAVSWVLPTSVWPRFCRLVAPLVVPNITADPRGVASDIRRILGKDAVSGAPEAVLETLAAEQVLSILQILREYRPGGLKPQIHVEGMEHVKAALERGRGAVLWVGYTYYADLIAKMAFDRSDLPIHHLSRPSHGFSWTRFGIRFLNPIKTSREDRYIAERVMLNLDVPGEALHRLAQQLAGNAVVSITARGDARQPVSVKLLNGTWDLAPGAAFLAAQTGAVLLPVFPYRDADGRLCVRVDRPLHVPSAAANAEIVAKAAEDYAARLEPFVRENPGQWMGWLHD